MIIVTGGAGFIGSNLIKYLNQNGYYDIIIVDNVGSTIKFNNLTDIYFTDYIHKNDLWKVIDNYTDGIETIIHLGACSNTMVQDFEYLIENNFHYTQKLWNYCTKNKIKFIYASSAATYGDSSNGFSDDHQKIFSLKPLNPYGLSKHLFDKWCLRNKLNPPFWAGLKFFNVYGPNEFHKGKMASMALQSINQIKSTNSLKLFKSNDPSIKDGDQVRDFIYVEDVVKVIFYFLINDIKSGIYNLGTGKPESFNKLAQTIMDVLDISGEITYIEIPESIKGKFQNMTNADMCKLRSVGYKDNFNNLDKGIRKYINEIQ